MSAIAHDTPILGHEDLYSWDFSLARYMHAKKVDKRAYYAYTYGNYEAGMFILAMYDAYLMGGEL